MTRKKLMICTILFALAAVLSANDLKSVCNGLARNSVTRGDFTQVKEVKSAKGTRSLKSYGNVVLCTQGIIWDTQKPFPSKMVISKERIVQISSDGKQSVVDGKDNPTFLGISATITAVFSGDMDEINKRFFTEFKDLGEGKWSIALKPKDSSIASVVGSITLSGVSSDTTTLESMVIQEAGDSSVLYQFANHKYSKDLTSDEKALFAL